MGFGNQHQQVGGHRHVLAQPHVQGLLQGPGSFAHVVETDHAATALERMGRTTNRRQGLDIAAIAGEHGGLFSDASQNLVRLFEEDPQQFGIDCLVARLRQFQRLRRRRRRFRLLPRSRGCDLGLPCLVTGFESQDGVRHVAERRTVYGLFAENEFLWRLPEILEQYLRFLPRLFGRDLDTWRR